MLHEKLVNLIVVGGAVLLPACGALARAREDRSTTPGAPDIVLRAYRMRMEGKIDEAKRALEESLEKRSQDAAVWLELARLEIQKSGTTRELDSGQRAIEKAIDIAPDNPVYHRWAAGIAVLNGILKSHANDRPALAKQFKKAIAAGERAVTLDPDDHEARLLLVSLYGNNPPELGGDQRRGRHHVEELEKRSPVDGAAARCEFSLKDVPEKKLALWNDLAVKHGADPRVHESLALEYAWSGEVEKATFHAERVLALDRTRVRILLDLARAFALKENLPIAERFAGRYLALDPAPPLSLKAWAHMALGQIQRKAGNEEAAAASLKRARELDPYCWFTMTPPGEELFEPPASR
jgi:tetratricopeptide (TPR) repeat protein